MRGLKNEHDGFKGIWIPASLWEDKNLNTVEKIAMSEIQRQEGSSGVCKANNSHFSDFLGVSKGSASKIISSLRNKGYISVEIIKNEKNQVIERCIVRLEYF